MLTLVSNNGDGGGLEPQGLQFHFIPINLGLKHLMA